MAGSIAHPDPAACGAALGRFLMALDGALGDAAAIVDRSVAASLDEFARLLRSIDTSPAARDSAASPERLAVCRFWEASLEAREAPRPLVAPLDALGASLAWAQNPNYLRRPPDATFLDNYGYAVIVGPAAGPPPLAVDPRLALGVLLLGPRAHYPLHAHPAVEVYYTLSAGEWWRDDGPWRAEPPGVAMHHPSGIRHATRAGDSPLLAIYLWRGDLATHARLASGDGV